MMKKEARTDFYFAFIAALVIIFLISLTFAKPSFNSAAGSTTNGTEDTVLTYNFSANVTSTESPLSFSIYSINITPYNVAYTSVSDFYWININSITGVMTINSTLDNETGFFDISITVVNSTNYGDTAPFYFNISARNDAPNFTNLGGNRVLDGSYFQMNLTAADEERDNNFTFNVSFITCPGGSCQLFNLSYLNETAANISFNPSGSTEGVYEINFSIKDNRSSSWRNEFVNWTLDWNEIPYFTYVCDNERNATEDAEFTCRINATDLDETNNLTIISNYSWFTFNATTLSNSVTIPAPAGNISALVNFTANDTMVGNWSVNVTLTDTSLAIGRNSTVFWFYIANVNDSLALHFISNVTAYTSNNYTIQINASDDDLLVPDKNVFNETLTFTSNSTFANTTVSWTISGTNISTANITFNPNDFGAGNHSINISVNDSNGFSKSSQVFTIQVLSNSAPSWNAGTETNFSLAEDTAFYLNLTQNVTEPDSDSLTFSFTNYSSFSSFSLNSTTGIINFTPTDDDIGEQIVGISVSDGITPVTLTFNFTISNTNDVPIIEKPLTGSGVTINSTTSSMDGTESIAIQINLFAQDNDLKIPSVQKSFYNESLNVSLNFSGPTAALFTFTKDSGYPNTNFPNSTLFTATFTPSSSNVGTYRITANVSDMTNSSEIIQFNITIAAASAAPAPSASGGGGGTSIEPASLKIIIPGPVSSKRKDKIILPVQLYNDGKVDLREIIIEASIAKNKILRSDLIASFDNSFFSVLKKGESKNLTLIIDVDTEESGLYEVTINATVKSPSFTDWGKVYITVEEGKEVEEKIIFTEEYIVGNPQCAELQELVNEAKVLYRDGKFAEAGEKLNEALDACSEIISLSPPIKRMFSNIPENAVNYTSIASLAAFAVGFSYYYYKRRKLRRSLEGY